MDALTASKANNRSHSSLDVQDTQTAIVMADKVDAELSTGKYQPKSLTEGEFIVTPQTMVPPNLNQKEQLERNGLSPDWHGYNLHPVKACIASHIGLCLLSSLVSPII